MDRNLQTLNKQTKIAMWSERVAACRNSELSVAKWCKENGICEATYYTWQRRIFEITKAQQTVQFTEVTEQIPERTNAGIAVTVELSGAEVHVHNSADVATVKAVLQMIRPC